MNLATKQGLGSRFALHLIVGAFSTGIYLFLALLSMDLLRLNEIAAVTIAFTASCVFSYFCNRAFVYAELVLPHKYVIGKYLLALGISYLLNVGIVWACVNVLGLSNFFSLLATTLFVPPANYFLNSRWVFRETIIPV